MNENTITLHLKDKKCPQNVMDVTQRLNTFKSNETSFWRITFIPDDGVSELQSFWWLIYNNTFYIWSIFFSSHFTFFSSCFAAKLCVHVTDGLLWRSVIPDRPRMRKNKPDQNVWGSFLLNFVFFISDLAEWNRRIETPRLTLWKDSICILDH